MNRYKHYKHYKRYKRHNRHNRHNRTNHDGRVMPRTSTTQQVADALHVGPEAVRKYAREHRLPFDTTPGGHRRFDIAEAVAALGDQHRARHDERGRESELPGPVPYVRVEPESEAVAIAIVTAVDDAEIVVHDTVRDVEDWAAETPVV
jgi:hypothetical protein